MMVNKCALRFHRIDREEATDEDEGVRGRPSHSLYVVVMVLLLLFLCCIGFDTRHVPCGLSRGVRLELLVESRKGLRLIILLCKWG